MRKDPTCLFVVCSNSPFQVFSIRRPEIGSDCQPEKPAYSCISDFKRSRNEETFIPTSSGVNKFLMSATLKQSSNSVGEDSECITLHVRGLRTLNLVLRAKNLYNS